MPLLFVFWTSINLHPDEGAAAASSQQGYHCGGALELAATPLYCYHPCYIHATCISEIYAYLKSRGYGSCTADSDIFS
uniref:Uncharacterized protein n=1 Tax=Oryza brachyantha TaxID=4533 RepID=J3M3P8_ORYBR